MDDFMGGMFDLNEVGHTDLGEEFMAYKLYEDMIGVGRPMGLTKISFDIPRY